jgi:hypothetical protein
MPVRALTTEFPTTSAVSLGGAPAKLATMMPEAKA